MSARFVSGPSGRGRLPARSARRGSRRRGRRPARAEGSGSSGPSRPVSPCTCAAVRSSRRSGASAPAATGMSVLPAISSVTSALRVVLSSVWFPATVVTPISSTSGEASARRIAIASSWPGSQSMTIGVLTASASTSSAVGSEVWAPKREAASAPAAHARRSDSSRARPSSSETTRQAVNASPAASAVDRLDRGRLGPRHLLPVLEQHGALGAERETDEAARLAERLELEPVHDRQLGRRRAVARRRRVEKEARRELGRPRDRLGRDLLLAQHRVGIAELEGRRAAARRSRPGATTIVVSPAASTVMSAMPVGASFTSHRSSTSASRSPASACSASSSRPTQPTSATSAPSRAAATAWFAPLPPARARSGAGHRLARTRQPLRPHDEVEVDRADDGEARRCHGASLDSSA